MSSWWINRASKKTIALHQMFSWEHLASSASSSSSHHWTHYILQNHTIVGDSTFQGGILGKTYLLLSDYKIKISFSFYQCSTLRQHICQIILQNYHYAPQCAYNYVHAWFHSVSWDIRYSMIEAFSFQLYSYHVCPWRHHTVYAPRGTIPCMPLEASDRHNEESQGPHTDDINKRMIEQMALDNT